MTDARFEDGQARPLNLAALEVEDLAVISSLSQDAVFPVSEMRFDRVRHRFALLLNRFRWEDGPAHGTRPERVQSLLVFNTVTAVATQGFDRRDDTQVMSLLSITFEETDAPSGHLHLTLAGDGALRLTVEALEVNLKDVTKPYLAPSRKSPRHPD